jgi:hypothetical protein
MTIDWPALERAIKYYEQNIGSPMMNYTDAYRTWILDNWGIEHGDTFIKIVDQQKYMMFLLRFA